MGFSYIFPFGLFFPHVIVPSFLLYPLVPGTLSSPRFRSFWSRYPLSNYTVIYQWVIILDQWVTRMKGSVTKGNENIKWTLGKNYRDRYWPLFSCRKEDCYPQMICILLCVLFVYNLTQFLPFLFCFGWVFCFGMCLCGIGYQHEIMNENRWGLNCQKLHRVWDLPTWW